MPRIDDVLAPEPPFEYTPLLDELYEKEKAREQNNAAPRSRRGGPRPGSGAPRGNLNAMKHGRSSRRQKQLLEAMLQLPEAREALIAIARRNRRRKTEVETGAVVLMTRLLQRIGEQVLAGEDNQPQINLEFLQFLNTTTAQIENILAKQPMRRPTSTKQ